MVKKCWAISALVFISILIAGFSSGHAALTDGYWDVSASDHCANWDDTVLVFTSQNTHNEKVLLTGYFDWMSATGTQSGREIFTGILYPDMALKLIGIEIDPGYPWLGIRFTRYEAEMKPSSDEILNGTWGNGSTLSAVQVVPIPGAAWLLGTGLIGFIGIRRKVTK